MLVIGIDAHKKSLTAVAADGNGRQLAEVTVPQSLEGYLGLLRFADGLDTERRFGVEDCRHLTGSLERALLDAGESLTRVPPSLMATTRIHVRAPGKSDPIDALAVARAMLAEENLPTARLDSEEREIRLLSNYRDSVVADRTALINDLRWRLYDLDPHLEATCGDLTATRHQTRLADHLTGLHGTDAEIALDMVTRIGELTATERDLTRRIITVVTPLAPTLLAVRGCGPLTAAKIITETADITRFRDRNAYASYTGTAPIPVWSGSPHHRLNRGGNRQLNAALHRIAVTQLRYPGPAQDAYQQLRAAGKTHRYAYRILRRRLSDIIYRTLRTDHTNTTNTATTLKPAA
jgi:transposase